MIEELAKYKSEKILSKVFLTLGGLIVAFVLTLFIAFLVMIFSLKAGIILAVCSLFCIFVTVVCIRILDRYSKSIAEKFFSVEFLKQKENESDNR